VQPDIKSHENNRLKTKDINLFAPSLCVFFEPCMRTHCTCTHISVDDMRVGFTVVFLVACVCV